MGRDVVAKKRWLILEEQFVFVPTLKAFVNVRIEDEFGHPGRPKWAVPVEWTTNNVSFRTFTRSVLTLLSRARASGGRRRRK